MVENMTGNNPTGTTNKYCIIHGHFYQPPRENPWIQIIEKQPSAAPYHDWNERIYDECYRPNAYSRILDPEGMIKEIHNNYTNLSFNFGPTLFTWLEDKHPKVAQQIIDADKESFNRLNSHGNAIAQIYNHIIMPLASRRDKLTQIRWAKSFFSSRFNRETEGMWLSETAINMETVECLIQEGIRFVVLSPNQAQSYRPLESNDPWTDIDKTNLNTKYPYRIYPYNKANKKQTGHLDVFFFDEQLSRATSFEDVLTDASILSDRISERFLPDIDFDQTVTIATDGETFGHHKPFGDMCLAYFFKHIASKQNIIPVNFGYYLDKNPPHLEVKLKDPFGEGSSWSCVHGTGRWIRNCGCQTGGEEDWNQKWRKPLRKALDTLQTKIDKEYVRITQPLLKDPWVLRDHYEPYNNNNTQDTIENFLIVHGHNSSLETNNFRQILSLLEAQKNMLYAYTSCAWFFSDISGIETIQNLLYACRAIQLGLNTKSSQKTIDNFLDILDKAKSNCDNQTGKTIFNKHIKNYNNHLHTLCLTAIIEKTIFSQPENNYNFFNYNISLESITKRIENNNNHDEYTAYIKNNQTGESASFSILVIHKNGFCSHGFILPANISEESTIGWKYENWKEHPESILIKLPDLFSESKFKLTKMLTNTIAQDTLKKHNLLEENQETILDSISAMNNKLPDNLQGTVSFILTNQWNSHISGMAQKDFDDNHFVKLRTLWEQSLRYGVTIDYSHTIDYLQKLLSNEIRSLASHLSIDSCERMRYLLNIVDRFSIPIAKSKLEDSFFPILTTSVTELYNRLLQNKSPKPSDKSLLLQMLNFARRINFNTEKFPISTIDNNKKKNTRSYNQLK